MSENPKLNKFSKFLKNIAMKAKNFDAVVNYLVNYLYLKKCINKYCPINIRYYKVVFECKKIKKIGKNCKIELDCKDIDIQKKQKEKLDKDLENKIKEKLKNCYGVYIIRCICKDNTSTVFYIGKSGTYCRANKGYQKQTVCERLKAPRSKYIPEECKNVVNFGNSKNDVPAEEWFRLLKSCCCQKCKDNCELEIEVICLDQPQNDFLVPAFVEALLLQYYYLEKNDIPMWNAEF